MSSLKQHIGYVSQQPRLFADTVFINLCYRNPDATEQEVFDAATVAGINDFIESTPQGYATLINPNGVNLSGGQKQCLAIARALIKKPDILIFDEPTAALNLKTEKTLFNRLPDVMQSKTLFMVTHRPATIRNCERIILLGENHLVTGGSHAMLLDSSVYYRPMVTADISRQDAIHLSSSKFASTSHC